MEKTMNLKDMYRKLDTYYENGDYQAARLFLENIIDDASRSNDLERLVAAGNEVAGMYRASADLDKAIDTYELVLKNLEELRMIGTNEYAIAQMNTANSYGAASLWEKALELYRSSLQTLKKNDFNDKYTLAAVNNGLSRAYAMNGNLNDAEDCAFEALVYICSLLPDSYPEMATTYTNIAEIRLQQNRLEDACVYFRKAIEIYLGKLHGKDIHYANACYGLAKALLACGDKLGAAENCRKALDLIYRDFGENEHYRLVKKMLADINWK